MAEKLDKIAESDSPTRCQFSDKTQQCVYEAVAHQRCHMHQNSAGLAGLKDRQANLRRYRLSQHFARVDALAGDLEFKDMREEVAIQRLLVEETLNQCKTPFDLLCNSQRISDLVMKVQKSVMACHKLETALGQVLDKPTLFVFVDSIIKMLAEEITDEILLRKISERLTAQIENLQQREAPKQDI